MTVFVGIEMTSYTYNNAWLLSQVERGNRQKYVFFWGHRGKKGEVTKACFSQWYPSPFSVEGRDYPTTEHWMMAEKARLFGHDEIYERVFEAETPGKAKALGRKVEGFKSDVWDAEKFHIVVQGNHHKFSQNAKMGAFLLGTGNRVLVEASPVDKVWGIGLAVDNENVENPRKWKGENLLGYALMEVRDRLRE